MTEHDDEYDPADDLYGYQPKEEPDCGYCNDHGWVTPRGWRFLPAQLAPFVWGRDVAWDWRPRRGTWPCDGCNPAWIDWQLRRVREWRHRLFRRKRVPAGNFDDEAPF